jgi:hypothetical protein
LDDSHISYIMGLGFWQGFLVMFRRTETRFRLIPIALLALLLVGMTLTSVIWHHHDAAAEAGCPICHLSHQPIDRPVAVNHAPTFGLVAPTTGIRDAGLAPTPAVRRVPARAPPAA